MQEKEVTFLIAVVQEIVEYPLEVHVDRRVDEMGVLLSLTVAPEDTGTVIGRDGVTAKALRTLLRIIGLKKNARINLKILDSEPANSDSQASLDSGQI